MCKEWESLPPLVSWLSWGRQGLYFLSLSVSRIKRRAYILRIGQSFHRLDKHTSALDWALQEVTEVVQVLAWPPEGHPTSSSLAGSSHSSKDFRVGKTMPCHPPQLFLYSSTQQPGCATRDDVNTVERERAVPEGQRNQQGQLCVLMIQQQPVIVRHVTAPFLYSNEEDTIAISTSLRKLKFPHLVRLTFKLTLILEPIFLLMNPLVVNFS